MHRAVTACKHTVSGTISLPSRGTFHLSLTVLVHYRSVVIFSLTGWSPWIHSRFHVTRATQVPTGPPRLSPTGLSPTLARLSSALRLDVRVPLLSILQPRSPKETVWAIPFSFATTKRIEFSLFSSRYLDVSVPWVPSIRLCVQRKVPEVRSGGFPHSDIPGSKLASSLPRLIAGSHVLHRFDCLGIHRVPLIT